MGQKENEAYDDLKAKMVQVMYHFTLKYASKGENCLYPQCGYILVEVLQDCLQEARSQVGIDPNEEPDEEDEDEDYEEEYDENTLYDALKNKMHNFERKLSDMRVYFDDCQRASQVGVQNVYGKFSEIERRQIEIEELLKSDRIVDLVKKIPTENDIKALLMKVDNTDLSQLTKNIDGLRDELQEIIDRLTW